MARPKEFDREQAVAAAMKVFWEKGYEAASALDLTSAMGIGRQSMYDTFGDKQSLYFEVLRRYHRENGTGLRAVLDAVPSPLQGIRALLLAFAGRERAELARGCLGINATTAFGQFFAEVTALAAGTARNGESAFEQAVLAAQERGELAASLDPQAAARFLYTTLQGLTVRAQAGASSEALAEAANFAVEALTSMR